MRKTGSREEAAHRLALQYAAAVGISGVAVAGGFFLRQVAEVHDFYLVLLVFAVTLSGYVGGLGPGLLATVLSVFSYHQFLQPARMLGGPGVGVEMAQFLFIGIFLSLLNEALRRARDLAERARAAAVEQARRLEMEVADRRRASEALRESRERYRAFIENSSEAIWRMELDRPVPVGLPPGEQVEMFFRHGFLAECNDTMARMCGFSTPEELVGRRFRDLWPQANSGILELLKTFIRCDYRIQDGEWVETSTHGVRRHVSTNLAGVVEEGYLLRAWATHRDITVRRRADEALRESEERFRATFEQAAVGVVQATPNGRLLRANQGFCEIVGYRPEEIGSLTFRQLLHPEDDRGAQSPGERRFVRKDGTGVWVRQTSSLVRTRAGEPDYTVDVVENISDRKLAEEARARLAAIVESSEDAIIGQDLEGRIVSWNRGAERLFGYTAAEAVGREVSVLAPVGGREDVQELLSRVRRGERLQHFETERMRKDGVRVAVSLSVSAVRDAGGSMIGISKIARDITERRKAEQALREAQEKLARHAHELEQEVAQRTSALQETVQSMESFSYSVAHDLRAPLRAMQGMAALLLDEYGDSLDPVGRDHAGRIVTSANRMDTLIQDLLTYSRLSHAGMELDQVSLDGVMLGVLSGLEEELARCGARVRVARPLPEVLGNGLVLEQVLTNLVGNSLKFVVAGSTPVVEVRAEKKNDRVRLWVCDNGIGIDAAYHERIFKVFERLHPVSQYSGTGIGLAIVRKGIERMGGAVGVESSPGNGSRFWIELSAGRSRS